MSAATGQLSCRAGSREPHRFGLVPLLLALLLAPCFLAPVHGAEVIPPAPTKHFNDFAGVVSAATSASLDRKLEEFERATSSQVVVAVFPSLPPGVAFEDYTLRLAEAWKVGRKGRNNGAVLFVIIKDRRLRIETGYGLEGALPDALGEEIIADVITPHFHQGNYDAGLSAGVSAILQATRGEYRGTGRLQQNRSVSSGSVLKTIFLIFIVVFAIVSRFRRRGTMYQRGGRGAYSGWGTPWLGGFSGGGGGWSSGGSSGGGFSGGGGSFGGGGASGSW